MCIRDRSYVDELWRSLAEEFDLPSLTAVIHSIVDGSLKITWLILSHIAQKIRATYSKALRFYQLHSIVELYIDDDCLYDEQWTVSVTTFSVEKLATPSFQCTLV